MCQPPQVAAISVHRVNFSPGIGSAAAKSNQPAATAAEERRQNRKSQSQDNAKLAEESRRPVHALLACVSVFLRPIDNHARAVIFYYGIGQKVNELNNQD